MSELVGALDQGTSSTRFVLFDVDGSVVASEQVEHRQHFPHPGWVEHDAEEIWSSTVAVIGSVLGRASLALGDLQGIGIANQRETTVVWERSTGRPIGPAIVWQDGRTASSVDALVADGHRSTVLERTGLPLTTYPSALKVRWILDHTDDGPGRAERGELCFGTIDSWLIWRMTGQHVTDVTNASRTMLMDLSTLAWDDDLLDLFGVPRAMLPEIGSSSRPRGALVADRIGDLAGAVSVTGILGDQQAALVGQGCFAPGSAKNTYGTGNFLLLNTGDTPVRSTRGLITTVAYRFEGAPAAFALEGAIAVTGAAIRWLRDQLGIITSVAEVESLASSVASTDGLYFVPAFSGLFAPYWRSDARGVIVGMTASHGRAHLARAALEAVAFQSRDVIECFDADGERSIAELKVDGGMTANSCAMQIQADVLGRPVVRAAFPETTVRGAAFAAGLGAGLWGSVGDLPVTVGDDGREWEPQWSASEREERYRGWRRAVERSLDWAEGERAR